MDAWYSGATKYPVGDAGSYAGGPKKCIVHTTENDPNQTSAMDVASWMKNNKPGSVYHIIIHPITGEMVQMLPVNGSAKALSNPSGGVETNRCGSLVIQISFVARASDPFTRFPLPGWPQLREWIVNWGVPLYWAGPQPVGKVDRVSNSFWNTESGWYGHCCVPENDHHDPGAIDLNVLLGGGSSAPPTIPPDSGGGTGSSEFSIAFDGGAAMTLRYLKRTDPMMQGGDVKSLQLVLNAKGQNCGNADGIFGDKTKDGVKKFQSTKGIAVDGVVGPTTMEKAWEA
jgi:hypothetical protein